MAISAYLYVGLVMDNKGSALVERRCKTEQTLVSLCPGAGEIRQEILNTTSYHARSGDIATSRYQH